MLIAPFDHRPCLQGFSTNVTSALNYKTNTVISQYSLQILVGEYALALTGCKKRRWHRYTLLQFRRYQLDASYSCCKCCICSNSSKSKQNTHIYIMLELCFNIVCNSYTSNNLSLLCMLAKKYWCELLCRGYCYWS